MLPWREPQLNGIILTHAELRALHSNMRIAISAATRRNSLLGESRLLSTDQGERYTLKAHARDAAGNLLASVTVESPREGWSYVRKVRLVRQENTDLKLKVEVDREQRNGHS